MTDRRSPSRQIDRDTGNVGRNISTKSVFGNAREDVTGNYKYPEGKSQRRLRPPSGPEPDWEPGDLLLVPAGSAKEREVYGKAGRRVEEPGRAEAEPLQLSVRHGTAVFGTDFDVVAEVRPRPPPKARSGFGRATFDPERLCAGEEHAGRRRRRTPAACGHGRDLQLCVPGGVPETERQPQRARSLRLAPRTQRRLRLPTDSGGSSSPQGGAAPSL